jgi:hypothetical protein
MQYHIAVHLWHIFGQPTEALRKHSQNLKMSYTMHSRKNPISVEIIVALNFQLVSLVHILANHKIYIENVIKMFTYVRPFFRFKTIFK